MSDIEKLFLAAYPLWPKSLLTKFSSLLSFEVAKFNPDINQEIIKQYNLLGSPKKFQIQPYVDNVNYVFSPSNGSKNSQIYYGREIVKIDKARSAHIVQFPWPSDLTESKPFQGKLIYDTRIFKSVSVQIIVDYSDQYGPVGYSFLSFMGYDSVTVYWLNSVVNALASFSLNDYSGAFSVMAMIENGISVDVDQKLLSEFVTFLNAYNKYSGELAAANSLQAEKNRQTMTDYKNSINEKLNSRKNELNDLRTQISFAAKNETASAKRDMQSLTLSAQSLMVQLQDKLK